MKIPFKHSIHKYLKNLPFDPFFRQSYLLRDFLFSSFFQKFFWFDVLRTLCSKGWLCIFLYISEGPHFIKLTKHKFWKGRVINFEEFSLSTYIDDGADSFFYFFNFFKLEEIIFLKYQKQVMNIFQFQIFVTNEHKVPNFLLIKLQSLLNHIQIVIDL